MLYDLFPLDIHTKLLLFIHPIYDFIARIQLFITAYSGQRWETNARHATTSTPKIVDS